MDISSLREPRCDSAFTVTELNNYIKGLLDNDRLLRSVTVKGEISNFICHRSGHLYFTLKDSEGQIRSVMFRSSAVRLRFVPENGMRVIVHGSVNVYTRDGSVQLYATQIQPDGVGALYLAYEQLKARLAAEGLFDSSVKREIPRIPMRIGVITSPTGAAIRDILNILGRRFPCAAVYLYPALVQGDGAEDDLVAGVDYFDRSGLADVVIIGRGGGSIEDLWAFNSERLARRIFAARVPIISAVGHETDFTICDFVSDLRAPTPSAAAELAVPDGRELALKIDSLYSRAGELMLRLVEAKSARLNTLKNSKMLVNPTDYFREKRKSVAEIYTEMKNHLCNHISRAVGQLAVASGRLDALSPMATLARGYSIVLKDGEVVRRGEGLQTGDVIEIKISDSDAKAKIISVNRRCNDEKKNDL